MYAQKAISWMFPPKVCSLTLISIECIDSVSLLNPSSQIVVVWVCGRRITENLLQCVTATLHCVLF